MWPQLQLGVELHRQVGNGGSAGWAQSPAAGPEQARPGGTPAVGGCPLPGPPVRSPAPPARPRVRWDRGRDLWSPEPRVWVELLWALGLRKSRREGVWVLSKLFYSGSQRSGALRQVP